MRRAPLAPLLVALVALPAACAPARSETAGPARPPAPAPAAATSTGTTSTTTTGSSAARRDPTPGTARLRRVGTPADPLRILLVGDSVGITAIPTVRDALTRLAPRAGPFELIEGAAMGFGLTADLPGRWQGRALAPMFPGWRERWDGLLAARDPDAVLVLLGPWDAVPRAVGGRWLDVGSAAWRAWYRGLVVETAGRLAARGARVTWLAAPCIVAEPGPALRHPKAVARAAARAPGDEFGFVDLDAMACPRGRFRAALPGPSGEPVTVRTVEGTHLTAEAATVLGPPLAAALAADWALP